MAIGTKLGRLALRNFIRAQDIKPVLTTAYIPMYRGWHAGLVTSVESTDDINITAGECRDATNTTNIILTSEITKKSDTTWSAGDDAGGLNTTDFTADSDGLKANTTYHVFLIKHADGTVDAGLDKDTAAAELLSDSGYTYYRRIGSVVTDGTAAPNADLIPWFQVGHDFRYKTPPAASVVENYTESSAQTVTMSGAPGGPVGFKYKFFLNMLLNDTGGAAYVYVASLEADEVLAVAVATPFSTMMLAGSSHTTGQIEVHSNTSAQFQFNGFEPGGGQTIDDVAFALLGWHDDLGEYD